MIQKNEINFKSSLEKKVIAINEWKCNTNGRKSKQINEPRRIYTQSNTNSSLIGMLDLCTAFALEVRVILFFCTQVRLHPVYLLWPSLSWISHHHRYIFKRVDKWGLIRNNFTVRFIRNLQYFHTYGHYETIQRKFRGSSNTDIRHWPIVVQMHNEPRFIFI